MKSIGTLHFLSGLVLIGILEICLAIGIRKLIGWTKIPAIIVAAPGPPGFPIGTLISVYFLYLHCSKKGSLVFSAEYARIIAGTPHIKYRTSIFVWILLFLLVALILGLGIYGNSV